LSWTRLGFLLQLSLGESPTSPVQSLILILCPQELPCFFYSPISIEYTKK
jgi:hypothetical protein